MAQSSQTGGSNNTLPNDPWRAVVALGSRRWRSAGALVIASASIVHGAAAGHGYRLSDLLQLRAFSALVTRAVHERVRGMIEIEVEPPKPPPEPEPEKEPEPEPEAKPEPPPPPAAKAATPEPPKAEPPPPAAEAGKVLAAEPDPNEPLDLTGNTFVSGTGERYVGGVTATSGKGQRAGSNPNATADGVVGGKGTAPAPAAPVYKGPNLTRAAGRSPNSRLERCPWPAEADVEQINYMLVPVLISYDATGKITSAQVMKDPGAGFGRETERCVMRDPPVVPALNAEGKPVPGTMMLKIRYDRR